MIEFVKDWMSYRAGATVAADVLGGGVVDVLAKRGIVRAAPPKPPAAEPPKPPKPQPARGRR